MRLEIDAANQLVRQIRTARSYEDLATLNASLQAMVAQMQGIDRAEWTLLQDMRSARGRNDPQFEDAVKRVRPAFAGGFRKVAVLVSTQVGRLQVQRFLEKSESPSRVFLDEHEATDWLSERD